MCFSWALPRVFHVCMPFKQNCLLFVLLPNALSLLLELVLLALSAGMVLEVLLWLQKQQQGRILHPFIVPARCFASDTVPYRKLHTYEDGRWRDWMDGRECWEVMDKTAEKKTGEHYGKEQESKLGWFTHMHTRTHRHKHTRTRIHIHTVIHTHTHTYAPVYLHIHTPAHT